MGSGSVLDEQGGVGAGLGGGVDFGEGDAVVAVPVVEGEDLGDLGSVDVVDVFGGDTSGEFGARDVAVTVVVEAVELLLKSDEFTFHVFAFGGGAAGWSGRCGAGGEEEDWESEEGFHWSR